MGFFKSVHCTTGAHERCIDGAAANCACHCGHPGTRSASLDQPLPERKQCAKCGEVKPASAFRVITRPTGTPTLFSYCSPCAKKRRQERRARLRAEAPPCSEEGCALPVYVLKSGLCENHYARLRRVGHTRGLPTAEERLWRYVDMSAGPDACWPWTGERNCYGYGRGVTVGGRRIAPHRLAYLLSVGPIPDGIQLDHLCHTRDETCAAGSDCPHRRCVNPSHLEPVTPLENTRRGRGHGKETHCPQGHPYDAENTYVDKLGRRVCRTCSKGSAFRSFRKTRWKGNPTNASKTHCPQGHPYDEVNTYTDKLGRRSCRICKSAAARRHQARKAG